MWVSSDSCNNAADHYGSRMLRVVLEAGLLDFQLLGGRLNPAVDVGQA